MSFAHVDADPGPPPRERPPWDVWFMRLAYVTAQRGSCPRKQVGALIVRDSDKRIISGGYNGAPRGMPDCLEVGCEMTMVGEKKSCTRTLHAESNALDLAGVVNAVPHTLYTTVIPCKPCARRIIQAGIRRVVFHEYYESQNTKDVIDLFARRDSDARKHYESVYGTDVALTHIVNLIQLKVPADLLIPSYEGER